jgi:hypothetical protein
MVSKRIPSMSVPIKCENCLVRGIPLASARRDRRRLASMRANAKRTRAPALSVRD